MTLLMFLAEEGHAASGLLDPHSWGLVFWTGVTFCIVLLALSLFAWRPLLEALEQREQSIAGQVQQADAIRQEAAQLKAKYEAQLEGVRQEAQQIINEGEADKKRILEEAHARASRDAQDVKSRAEREIQLAKQKALAELKQDAVSIGIAIAERVLAAEIDGTRHKAIVDEVLTSYERG